MRSAGRDEAEFETFVAARSASLLRTGWLMTGSDVAAQDLVQAALLKVWLRWPRVVRRDAPEMYVRRVMVSTLLSWRRRKWITEQPQESVDDVAADQVAGVDLRASVQAALAGLPVGQRAMVVLRYFDDLSEKQTAQALGCSIGTVKSQTARAIARLRTDPRLDGLWDGQVSR